MKGLEGSGLANYRYEKGDGPFNSIKIVSSSQQLTISLMMVM